MTGPKEQLFVCEQNNGSSPLHFIVAKGYTDQTADQMKIRSSCYDLVTDILKYKLSEHECEKLIGMQDKNGNTALHLAYARRDVKMIRLLKRFGASENIKNKSGKTPLDMQKMSFQDVKSLLNSQVGPSLYRLDTNSFPDQ